MEPDDPDPAEATVAYTARLEYERRVRPGELFVDIERSRALVYLPRHSIKPTMLAGAGVSTMGASVTLAVWSQGIHAAYPSAFIVAGAALFVAFAGAVIAMELRRRRKSLLVLLPKGVRFVQSYGGRQIASASWSLLWEEVTDIVVHRTRHEVDFHYTTLAGTHVRQLHCWYVTAEGMDRLDALLKAAWAGEPLPEGRSGAGRSSSLSE